MAVSDFGWAEWCLLPLLPYMLLLASVDVLLDVFSGWVAVEWGVDFWVLIKVRQPAQAP